MVHERDKGFTGGGRSVATSEVSNSAGDVTKFDAFGEDRSLPHLTPFLVCSLVPGDHGLKEKRILCSGKRRSRKKFHYWRQ